MVLKVKPVHLLDAEDGELSGNPVEHGGVDSVIRFNKLVSANQSVTLDYWVVAATSQSDAQVIHLQFNGNRHGETFK